jgi:adenylate cyclase
VEAFVVRLDPEGTAAPLHPDPAHKGLLEDIAAVPGKPSIAVLAFTNMSGDPGQDYFSDGVADDIITELSRNHLMFVIARNSSFTYNTRVVPLT